MQTGTDKPIEQRNEPRTIWNMMFISLFIANMVMNLSMMMSNSILAVYANFLGATATTIGMMMSMFAVTALSLKIVSAPAMDTFNRKYLIIGAMSIMATAFFGYGISFNVNFIMFFRLLQGCGQAFGNVCCMAMVTEALPKEKYGAGIGYFSLAGVISQAIGPNVGLALVDFVGYNVTFFISSGLMVMAIVLASQIKYKFTRTKKFKISINNIIAKEAFTPATMLFFISIGFCVVNTFLIIFAAEQGVKSGIGLYFTVSMVSILLTRPVVGKLTDKFGLVPVFIPALTFNIAAFFIISYSHTLTMFLVAAVVSSFGFGACQPAIQTLAMKSVSKERRGVGSSTNFVGMDLGQLIGPVIAGPVAEMFGYAVMWRVMVIPLFISIMIVIVYRVKITQIENTFLTDSN